MKLIFPVCLVLLLPLGCHAPEPDDNNTTGDGVVLIVIDDLEARTAEQQAVLTDLTYWRSIVDRGHLYRVIDHASPDAKEFLDEKISKMLPALLVKRSGSGKLLASGRLPPDTKAIDRLIEKLGMPPARGPPKHVDMQGQMRGLGLKEPTPEQIQQRKRMRSLTEQLRLNGASLIPREKWRNVEYALLRDSRFVLNQYNSSACVGYSAAMACMKERFIRGHEFERLSGMYVYSNINGGQDNGAYISDAMASLEKDGICLESEFTYPKRFYREVPFAVRQGAQVRLSRLSYTIGSEEEMATALQLGLIVQAGVQVDGSFEQFDKNGVSAAKGQRANHSIHLYGMKLLDGKWRYLMGNSWGPDWGPWRDGSCYLNPDGIVFGDAFVHLESKWSGVVPKKGGYSRASDYRFTLAH